MTEGGLFSCIADYEKHAGQLLPKNACDYYRSGACGEYTLGQNKEAFKRLRIRPRMLRDISNRTTSSIIQGLKISAPIGISPTAMQRMAHPEGECATARAVGSFGSIFILSTLSTSSIEEVAEAAPNTIKWFQLYVYKNRKLTENLIQRAEKSGFKAIVLTVDATLFGIRYADLRNEFKLPSHLRLQNIMRNTTTPENVEEGVSNCNIYTGAELDEQISWSDINWLKSVTSLPIFLKGILTAEDATIGADLGVAGIIVSNHGARQLDTCPASIEALPEIVKAVGHRCDVYLDGGVSYGTDVFKALALGAKMVFLGRPAIWGLTCNGEKGVKHVLDILKNEFERALALSGCTSIGDIDPDMVVHESSYAKM